MCLTFRIASPQISEPVHWPLREIVAHERLASWVNDPVSHRGPVGGRPWHFSPPRGQSETSEIAWWGQKNILQLSQTQDPFNLLSAPLWTLLTDTESWSWDSCLYSSVHLCGTGAGHVIHPFPVLVRVADTFVCAWAIPEMTYFDAGAAKKRF